MDTWHQDNDVPTYLQNDANRQPYGMVQGNRTPLYVVGRLRVLSEAEGGLIIWDKTPEMAWEFWKKCYTLLHSGTLNCKEKSQLKCTMREVEYKKPSLRKQIAKWKKVN